jgi:hypothetical protein
MLDVVENLEPFSNPQLERMFYSTKYLMRNHRTNRTKDWCKCMRIIKAIKIVADLRDIELPQPA